MRDFRLWLGLASVVIAAGIVVPYGVLSGSAASLDVFAFWCLFAIAVVALIVVGTSGWRG